MKLKISAVNDKKFYKEFLNILFNYKKLCKNHHKKINDLLLFYNISLIIFIILFILVGLDMLLTKNYSLSIYVILLFIFLLIDTFININTYNMLKNYLNDDNDSEFIIDKDGIKLNKENVSSIGIKWESLSFILVGTYGIAFLANEPAGIIIDIPIIYLEDVKKCLSKMHKDVIIIKK